MSGPSMSAPLVSILIPGYNAARWLAATLESAVAQTWPEKEIILVDDGSTDGTLAVARSFEPRGVRVVTQPNRGASAARNHALRLARGDFLQFLDADDLLAPEKIARQLERLAGAPDRVASAPWVRFHDHPSGARFRPEPAWRDFASPADFFVLHYNEGWMMPPIAWLVPRPVAEKAGPWDESLTLNDDGEYFCRVLLASRGIVFCPGAHCFYRSGLPGSMSRRTDLAALRSLHRSIELNAATLERQCPTPAVMAALANAWQKLAYDLYPDLAAESRAAAARARALGGATRLWEAGWRLQLLSRFVGWRGAKRLQRMLERRPAP